MLLKIYFVWLVVFISCPIHAAHAQGLITYDQQYIIGLLQLITAIGIAPVMYIQEKTEDKAK